MTAEKIVVVLPLEERHKKQFEDIAEAAGKEKVSILFTSPEKLTEEDLKDATATIGNINPNLLKTAKNLKWVQLNSAGTDGYLVPGVLPEGTVVTNATGAYGLAIAEHMLGTTLALMKRFPIYLRQQDEKIWQDGGRVTSIYGSSCLVVGMGDIGSEYAMRMKALGSYVIGIRRTASDKPDYVDEMYTLDQLDECLSRADIVAASLPGTKETYHMFDENRFGKMKDGAIFINVGRGSAVDSPALAQALRSGKLFGAGIDVTEVEPLPAESELWNLQNLLITPHVSGGYHLQETLERIIRISLHNLDAYIHGTSMKSVVDFSTGYRKR